jgi:alkanesulfonate monooxygenase SsuD/methylene tetrahydromethanopterin reductase-like flavin-dependent oxidoreductase (luciferase family)
MKLGLWVTAHHPADVNLGQVFHDLVEQVRLARQLGFGSIASGQHYLTAPYQRLQTLPLLARLAAEAEGMEVVTSVLLLPLHNPVDIAEQAATMDVITGGRFILGLGLGHADVEYQGFGVNRQQRAARFEEAVEVMKLLWRGGPVEHKGCFFTVPATESMVRPVQQPHLRIWVGSGSEVAIRRAARMGDAWFPISGDVESLAKNQALYHSALAEYGNPVPPDFPIGNWVCLAEEEAQALAEGHRFLGPQDDEAEFRARVRTQHLVGTPEQCVQRVREYRERLGATHLFCRVQAPGMTQAQVLRTIRLLGEQVLPSINE